MLNAAYVAAVLERLGRLAAAAGDVAVTDDDLDGVAVGVVLVEGREDVVTAPGAGALEEDALLAGDGGLGGLRRGSPAEQARGRDDGQGAGDQLGAAHDGGSPERGVGSSSHTLQSSSSIAHTGRPRPAAAGGPGG